MICSDKFSSAVARTLSAGGMISDFGWTGL
jgi:hypothetical protein